MIFPYVDHEHPRGVFQDSLKQGTPRMVTVQSSEKKGKSRFVEWCVDEAKSQQLKVIHIDLKSYTQASEIDVLGEICHFVGKNNCRGFVNKLTSQDSEKQNQVNINIHDVEMKDDTKISDITGIDLTHIPWSALRQLTDALFEDIKDLPKNIRVALLIDHFEIITPQARFKDWLIKLIHRFAELENFITVIAGTLIPHLPRNFQPDLYKAITLPEALEWEHWHEFGNRVGLLGEITEQVWKNFYQRFSGDPYHMSFYASIMLSHLN